MLFICNLTAGGGSAQEKWQRAFDYIRQAGFAFDYRVTTHSGHATTLTQAALAHGERDIVAVGGDGTLNEVLRAAWDAPCRIGILPLGTGNDYARHLNISEDPLLAAQVVMDGVAASFDVGFANGLPFINNAGIGIDVLIMELHLRLKKHIRNASASYILATLWALLSYRFPKASIEIDGQVVFDGRLTLCSAGNGQYIGGGMRCLPNARAGDGQLDICVVSKMSKLRFVAIFPKFIKGKHLGLKSVQYATGQHIRIQTEQFESFEMDGNIIPVPPSEFTIKPGAVQFFVPAINTIPL